MAIEPKSPRKRAVKKVSKKKSQALESPATEVISAVEVKKKSPVIPVPIFQAATTADKSAVKPRKKAVAKASKPEKEVSPVVASEGDDLSEDRNRRRRRGGRGRRKGPSDNSGDTANASDGSSDDGSSGSGEATTHRRRRRRRASGEGVTPGEMIEEDGVVTIVKVREVKERPARLEARRPRRDRNNRGNEDFERTPRKEYREPYRRRGTIITDGEFLARRENIDREMLVRQIADRTQIAVIEDGIMVEHYVNRNSNVSYVGNVYLGRVQNVLPSMEAAFVDIGKGRNAVLYAGEVNWDAAGISESESRKIETVLKTGQSVLVQVTKDPIGQKGARLTSQISLPGRYVVYVPGGGMSGISKRLPDAERSRLKLILKNLIPEEAGVIVRTASEGVSEKELTSDVARLKSQWEDIYQKSENPNFHAPAMLYAEPDLTVRVIRDIFNADFRTCFLNQPRHRIS